MIYLTGCTNNRDEPALIAAGVGLMVQPDSGYDGRVPRFPFYAADNGCFADKWNETKHLDWLDRQPRDRCLFAVAPDVYPDAAASLERGRRYFELIREMGFPVAVVAQDGAEHLEHEYPWDDFDCLFIGGARTTNPRDEWKIGPGAERIAKAARAHGKWVHMGRVNSPTRMARARTMGCNSADGTCLKYMRRASAGPVAVDIAATLVGRWMRTLIDTPTLPGFSTFESPSLPVHREAAHQYRT